MSPRVGACRVLPPVATGVVALRTFALVAVLPALLIATACVPALREPLRPPVQPESRLTPEQAASAAWQASRLYERRTLPDLERAADLWVRAGTSGHEPVTSFTSAARARIRIVDLLEDSAARREAAAAAVNAAQWCEQESPYSPVCAYWLGSALGVQARERPSTGMSALSKIEEFFMKAAAASPEMDHGGPDRALALFYVRAPGWPTGPGDAELGVDHARRAVTFDPEYPPNFLALGEALAEAGRQAEGRAALGRALDLLENLGGEGGPDSADWASRARALLEKLKVR